MEFKSLSELVLYVEQQLAANFYDGKNPVLRKAVLKVLARVIGAALYMLVLMQKKVWRNRFVKTCDIDALDGFGAEYAMPHKPPVYATGYVKLAVSGSGSVKIPAGTYFVDPLTGSEYYSISESDVANDGKVRVVASVAGNAWNLAADTKLQFRDSTPDKVNDEVVVVAPGVVGGKFFEVVVNGQVEYWGETAEEYRARLLNRVQNPPQGGSANDYKQWAERFNFVTKAFIKPNYPRINSVVVACANFANDSSASLDDDQVEEVCAYVNSPERRVVTADARVISVTPVKFLINATVAPFNDAVQESVRNALRSVLQQYGPDSRIGFDDVRVYVLANSSAEKFSIGSVQKYVGGVAQSVKVFELNLAVPENPVDYSNSIAEVVGFGIGESQINLSSGE